MPKLKRKSNGGRLTKAQMALRDERLLRSATRLFIAKGFANTTFEALANDARVALRTIYERYGGKDAIFAAVIRRQLTYLSSFQLELDSNASIRTALNRVAWKLMKFCTAPESVALQRLLTAESTRFPELMLTLSREGYRHISRTVAHVLSQGQKRGLLRIKNMPLATQLFVELTVGWTLMLAMVGDKSTFPSKKDMTQKVDLFLNTYGA
jgi:AcrR family transcriptional regulator